MSIKSTDWERSLLAKILEVIAERQSRKERCSIALTGGRSAERLYRAAANSPDFLAGMLDVDFYWGDERCVPSDHANSNCRLAFDTLFANGLPNGARVYRMDAGREDLDGAADEYASLLPSSIDVLLLSLGEDGHIASLFAQSPALRESRRRVMPIKGPVPPYQRLTFTPPVIESACHVFVMALGSKKRAMYEEALRDPSDVDSVPARLVLNRNWIFDPVCG